MAPGYGARMFIYLEAAGKWVEIEDRIASAMESEDIHALLWSGRYIGTVGRQEKKWGPP